MTDYYDDPFELDECQQEYRNDPENCDHSVLMPRNQDGEHWMQCALCGKEF